MPKKSPIFPGPRTARGAVLAILLSNADQAGAEPLRGRVTLAAIVRALKRKYHWPIETTSFPSNAAGRPGHLGHRVQPAARGDRSGAGCARPGLAEKRPGLINWAFRISRMFTYT
jgi:hypothetical protein